MNPFSGRRPSPAFVISLIALFVSASGVAYAQSRIGTNDIQNRAVTGPKIDRETIGTMKIEPRAISNTRIRTNSIRGGKLENNTVRGSKIDESTLGPVPMAQNFARYLNSGLQTAEAGADPVALLNYGPISFVGVCDDAGGGEPQARIDVASGQDGASVVSDDAGVQELGTFNDNDAETLAGPLSNGTDADIDAADFWVANADGSAVASGDVTATVNTFGANCSFQVTGFNHG